MNTEQCMKMMTAMKSACSSEAEFWYALKLMGSVKPSEPSETPSEAPVPKARKSPKSSDAAPKAPSAWNLMVTQTVSEMKQSGWTSWTDAKGGVWPASRSDTVKDKSGAESEQYVYDGGAHDGKQPSPALGGMARASYLKGQSEPEHAAKVAAYHAKKAEKSSAAASVASVSSDAEAEAAPKKGGRPKMTEEQKAAAKLKREAKKAAAPAPIALRGEWAELEEQKEKEE